MAGLIIPDEYYFSADFKQDTLQFKPDLKGIHVIVQEGNAASQIVLLYGIRSVEVFLWFLSFFKLKLKERETPIISLKPFSEKAYDGFFLINLPGFPVYSFARNYHQERILEKEIQVMDAQVFSKFVVEDPNREFCEALANTQVCPVKIDSVEPMGFGLENRSLLDLKAEVVFPKLQ